MSSKPIENDFFRRILVEKKNKRDLLELLHQFDFDGRRDQIQMRLFGLSRHTHTHTQTE